jgi:hypothetical protein
MLGAPLQDGTDTTLTNAVNATTINGCKDNEAFPSFFGTSAAAPHAAAIAALMLQADRGMTGSQAVTNLRATAIPMSSTNNGTYDYLDGRGFVDVAAAFSGLTVAVTSLTVSPSTVAPGATATLSWTGTNVSGCTASGSWSGAQQVTGTQTVTPSEIGTETFILTCTGTGGSTVVSGTTLTVATASSTGGSSGSGGSTTTTTTTTTGTTNPHNPFGGNKHTGALDLSTLLALGGVLLAGRTLRRRVPA